MGKKMLIVALGASAVFLALVGVLVLGLMMRWWGLATTEPEFSPGGHSNHIVVREPNRSAFSSDEAWETYQKHWRDPYWTGERPDERRYKTASFEGADVFGETLDEPIAGCVELRFSGFISDSEEIEIALRLGAREHYLLPEERIYSISGEASVVQPMLVYFDDDTDVWAKSQEAERMLNAEGSGRRVYASIADPAYVDRRASEALEQAVEKQAER